jgi:hypothetical protein
VSIDGNKTRMDFQIIPAEPTFRLTTSASKYQTLVSGYYEDETNTDPLIRGFCSYFPVGSYPIRFGENSANLGKN